MAAVLRTNVPSWSSARAVSAGITSATLSQVVVVQKGQLDQHVYKRLQNAADISSTGGRSRRLPIGSLNDHDALQGELCFSEAKPPGTYASSVPGDITLTVFTSFNGRDPDAEAIRFQVSLSLSVFLSLSPSVSLSLCRSLTCSVVCRV